MNDLEKKLDNLQELIGLIEKSYNSEQLNLHFDYSARADPALFENLYVVGLEAWHMVRVNQARKTANWFCDFFLLISNISVKVWDDHTQSKYPQDVIERLAVLLIELSQMTNNKEFEGDITSRNHEALANLLLAFSNDSDLRNLALTTAEEMTDPVVVDFVKRVIGTVEEIEKKES
jgi:hypothetical protein